MFYWWNLTTSPSMMSIARPGDTSWCRSISPDIVTARLMFSSMKAFPFLTCNGRNDDDLRGQVVISLCRMAPPVTTRLHLPCPDVWFYVQCSVRVITWSWRGALYMFCKIMWHISSCQIELSSYLLIYLEDYWLSTDSCLECGASENWVNCLLENLQSAVWYWAFCYSLSLDWGPTCLSPEPWWTSK